MRSSGLGCLITIISTFITSILLIVSNNDSPFLTELTDEEKFITSAESLFCASSNDSFVLVLFSKKILATVRCLKRGNLFYWS